MKTCLSFLLALAGIASAEVHQRTASPSGHYRISSEAVTQKVGGDTTVSPLGARVSLLDAEGKVLSSCFHAHEPYIDVEGRDDWQTKGRWNKAENLLAVESGGRTWSRVDFFLIQGGQILPLPHPDWGTGVLGKIPGFKGETTRLYEVFTGWNKDDATCTLELSGTAEVEGGGDGGYRNFTYRITLKVSMDGVDVRGIKSIEG